MESRASQVRIIASRPLPGKLEDPLAAKPETPADIRLFVPQTPEQEHRRTRAVRIGPFTLRGGGPLYELPLIEVSRSRTCLMFPRGARLAVGEIFEVVRPMRIHDDVALRPEKPRKVVARVRIIGIERGTQAIVHVLSGSVRKGYWAERVDEDRFEALPHPA